MSYQGTPTFRLLDPYVGWEADTATDTNTNIDGLNDELGLRIRDPHAGHVHADILGSYMPAAYIASDPSRQAIYLCGQAKDDGICFLMKQDSCSAGWVDLRGHLDNGMSIVKPVAITVRGNRLVVVDKHQSHLQLLIWSLQDGRLAGHQQIIWSDRQDRRYGDTNFAVTITPWHEVLLSLPTQGRQRLRRFDLAGRPRGELLAMPKSLIVRFATDKHGMLWAASKTADEKYFKLWRLIPKWTKVIAAWKETFSLDFRRVSNADLGFEQLLADSLVRTPVHSVSPTEVCVSNIDDELSETECVSRVNESKVPAKPNVPPPTIGLFKSGPIDSGIPRCHWHRIRIEVDLPEDSSYEVELATSEKSTLKPHRVSWQIVSGSPVDLLVDQPPGRYLFLHIRMRRRTKSPIVHRVRIDFPRVTSLDQLPSVYSEDPDAEDFTARFLSLFDAAIEDLDRGIEQLPALMNPDKVPDELLPWLGNFLGIVFDSNWTIEQRRALLRAAPRLYRQRGTVQGLLEALKLLFDVADPLILERPAARSWGLLNYQASLGAFRLFGRTTSRFRVGSSAIGAAPLNSFGNPDQDPVQTDAFHFEVLIPPLACSANALQRIDQLIANQKPAHTQHTVRIGGEGFIIGHRSVIGIDTKFVAPPSIVLEDGKANGIRLGAGVLQPGPTRPTSAPHLGVAFSIGVNTSLE